VFAERLRLARRKAGLSLQALGERLSPPVSAQAISKYERGKMKPSSAVLVGLGKVLDVSLDVLMSGQVAEVSGVEFRKNSGTSAQERAHAEALVIEKLEDYLAIEDILGLVEPGDPFAAVACDVVGAADEIEAKARDLRRVWQLGNDPILSMTDLLEEKGFKVIEADLPERCGVLTGAVKRNGDRRGTEVVIISSRSNIERKRFNLARELAHRVIKGVADPASMKLEKAMDRFAGAFLAPADHLREQVGEDRRSMTWHELIRLKQAYGISAIAMLIRLRDVGLLPEAKVDYAFRSYARAWRTEEPAPIAEGQGLNGFEKPLRFERLVYRALAEDMIAPVRAAQLLKLPLAKVEEGMRGPLGRRRRSCAHRHRQ
jgi:Zn-dependent peptidase ImmA (M78 family)/DNA-binding XRE family transcriptional regulator